MTSRISSDNIQQLTPLLGSLSRLVAEGSQLGEEELRILLLGADLEYDPILLKELKLWGRLLRSLHEQPLPELRRATVEALILRGVPEASVLLAVDTATSGVYKSTMSFPFSSTQHLKANPSKLDFGMLLPSQPTTREFEVQGGPGHVVVESDQLRVIPTEFGHTSTRVRVEVRGLSEGLLWTSLKLVTRSETLEVPVVGQWTDRATTRHQQSTAAEEGNLAPSIRPYTDEDIEYFVELTFREAYIGGVRSFNIQSKAPCSMCQGRGEMGAIMCSLCKGEGTVPHNKYLQVEIPAGVDNGSRIRVAGEGQHSSDGLRGDLYLTINVGSDPLFERKGEHIYTNVDVDLFTLILGGEVSLPLPDGRKLMLTIPAGTQNNTLFRLKGKGMPILGDNSRGNLYARVRAELPINLTAEEREVFKQLAQCRGLTIPS